MSRPLWMALLLACAAMLVPPSAAADDQSSPLGRITVIGAYETVALVDGGITVKAKVDTGADSSSVDARNIEPFQRDGEDWVRFELRLGDDRSVSMERPVADTVIIVSATGRERRYVIGLEICVGERMREAEFNLAERDDLDFRMLLGRKYLIDAGFLVNVAQEYSQEPTCDELVER